MTRTTRGALDSENRSSQREGGSAVPQSDPAHPLEYSPELFRPAGWRSPTNSSEPQESPASRGRRVVQRVLQDSPAISPAGVIIPNQFRGECYYGAYDRRNNTISYDQTIIDSAFEELSDATREAVEEFQRKIIPTTYQTH